MHQSQDFLLIRAYLQSTFQTDMHIGLTFFFSLTFLKDGHALQIKNTKQTLS